MKKLKIVLLGIIILGGCLLLTGCEYETTSVYQDTERKPVVECEHDWVVTSKYSFWTESYKTISKCSKCGKVVE